VQSGPRLCNRGGPSRAASRAFSVHIRAACHLRWTWCRPHGVAPAHVRGCGAGGQAHCQGCERRRQRGALGEPRARQLCAHPAGAPGGGGARGRGMGRSWGAAGRMCTAVGTRAQPCWLPSRLTAGPPAAAQPRAQQSAPRRQQCTHASARPGMRAAHIPGPLCSPCAPGWVPRPHTCCRTSCLQPLPRPPAAWALSSPAPKLWAPQRPARLALARMCRLHPTPRRRSPWQRHLHSGAT
jgi:hypothetical protein